MKLIVGHLTQYHLVHCLFLAELEGLCPQEMEGIDAILDRTEQRIVRQRSVSSVTSFKKVDTAAALTSCEPTENLQCGGDIQHCRQSVLHHQLPLREQTLHNIAESDDVFLDESLIESPV
jgi:hypothetical protein